MTKLSLAFDSPKGTYNVTYDPQEPMALGMSLNGEAIRCDVYIDESQLDVGHVVCGIAATGPGYWFELRLEPPRRIFFGIQGLDHVANEVENSN